MKKMIYFCPVDWRWIKQRPQFLAEELSRFYQMHVIYPFSKDRKGLQKGKKSCVACTPYFTLPTLGGKLTCAAKINKVLVRWQAGIKIRLIKPDIIWITLPEQVEYVPQRYRSRLIYDCMDDYVAFNENGRKQIEIVRQENDLIQQANLIFASSENLKRKLCTRYQVSKEKVVLLRNGYNANWKQSQTQTMNRKPLRIGYFGTISHWFDFELLLHSLEQRDDIEYHLYGPIAGGVQIPQNERLIYHGVVDHEDIERRAQELDVLMMPFKINELILSVDPVKLYEYICLNKNILCIRYPEVERFEPFTLFYRNLEEYLGNIDKLLDDHTPIYSREQAERFLTENSWERRAHSAYTAIEFMNHLEGKE